MKKNTPEESKKFLQETYGIYKDVPELETDGTVEPSLVRSRMGDRYLGVEPSYQPSEQRRVMNTYIIAYTETVDGPSNAVIAVQAFSEGYALDQASIYFEDWQFTEPEIKVTMLPSEFNDPIVVHTFTP